MIGETVSHYHIVEKLGQGGMGVVYRADDVRLGRPVALKFLPQDAAYDPEALRSLRREARVASALNHPNICTVYDVGQHEGRSFIVMELLEGETLAERVAAGPLEVGEALALGLQIASALEAAHAKGFIHRDLKPANVFVTHRGEAKVLDFGIAKKLPVPTDDSDEETSLLDVEQTTPSSLVGTIKFMAPEQFERKPADARTDIYALGALLYLMATGRRPFEASNASELMAKIIRGEPTEATRLNPEIPPELGRVISKCLQRNPEERYPSAGALVADLDRIGRASVSSERIGVLERAYASRGLAYSVVFILFCAVVWTTWLSRPEDPMVRARRESPPMTHASFTQLTDLPGPELYPSISPGGDSVVYAGAASGNWDIYVQRVGVPTAVNLTSNCPRDDYQPAYSPDGRWIAWRSERAGGGGVFVMDAGGESPRRVADFGFNPSWSPDGTRLVVATEGIEDYRYRYTISELWVIELESGEKRKIETADAVQPNWSPSGDRIAYWGRVDGGQRDLWTVDLKGGAPVRFTNDVPTDWNPVWSPFGDRLYFSSDRGGRMDLWGMAIDECSGQALGPPERLTAAAASEDSHLSFSRDGRRAVYVSQITAANLCSVQFDPASETVLGPDFDITDNSGRQVNPDPSPDGDWVTFSSTAGTQEDLFVIRTDGTELRQLTDDVYRDRFPRWSPGGGRIAFYSNRGGSYEIWSIQPDGGGLERLSDTPGRVAMFPDWSPDGNSLSYYDRGGMGSVIVELDPDASAASPRALAPIEDSQGLFVVQAWSPDGLRLAGDLAVGTRLGNGIVVYSFDTMSYERITDFGGLPRWLPDSRRLIFGAPEGLYLLDTATKETRVILTPDQGTIASGIGLSRDGRTIYFSEETSEADVWVIDFAGSL